MDLTDSFSWEDLPTRDADTGHLTAVGWIPLIQMYSRSVAIVVFCFHTVQSTIRMATNHETIFIVWYPFDWTVSPFYELVNISQVTFFLNRILVYIFLWFLNLKHWVNRYFFSFFLISFLPFILYIFLPLFPKMFSVYRALFG
jgi:hypothetical protein